MAQDGVIEELDFIFDNIFDREMIYAVSGCLKRIKKIERVDSLFGF